MRNIYFQKILSDVENNLKNKLGSEYCGLFSIADEIVSIYLNRHCYSNECEYIQYVRHYLLNIEFINWLKGNYIYCRSNFNFKKKLRKIELELFKIKKTLFYNWINGKNQEEIKSLENTKNFILKLRLGLLKNYPVFKLSILKKFKKELGL